MNSIKMSSSSAEDAWLFAMQLVTASVMPAAPNDQIRLELGLLELIKSPGPAHLFLRRNSPPRFRPPTPVDLMVDRTSASSPPTTSSIAASESCLTAASSGAIYSLAPVCEFLTRNEDGVSMAPLLLVAMGNPDAVVEGGRPFKRAHGMSPFVYGTTDPEFNAAFNQAMYQQSTLIMNQILEKYKGLEVEGLKTLVDVGGGTGATLNTFSPNIRSLQESILICPMLSKMLHLFRV
ncbi:UNVERIFIED_CONTAM: Caffeic acid 3-O-methyltransferase [Sesamum radiatum]|uniref:Caffeic acid 3-O-methyltransferase n=1 Tax=Sesamum radiatum TaxID=300843 RepID=A0AAW2TER3_SESRA